MLSSRGEDFRIRGEHSLLRERGDNSLAVLEAERAALFRISKQLCDRRGKGWAIVAWNDELAIILAHNTLHISDINRCNGPARCHRLEQSVWHLLCIGRQSEYVKRAKDRLGGYLAGKNDAVGNAEFTRQPLEAGPINAFTRNYEGCSDRSIECCEYPRRRPIFFSGRSGATVPTMTRRGGEQSQTRYPRRRGARDRTWRQRNDRQLCQGRPITGRSRMHPNVSDQCGRR